VRCERAYEVRACVFDLLRIGVSQREGLEPFILRETHGATMRGDGGQPPAGQPTGEEQSCLIHGVVSSSSFMCRKTAGMSPKPTLERQGGPDDRAAV
jgi:hypothetical protein